MLSATRKIDYGILLMASLPDPGSPHYISLSEISKRNNLSVKFLEQVVLALKKSDLLISKGGKAGGYQLKKKAKDITLLEIYEGIEGPLKLMSCLSLNLKCACEKNCPTKSIWSDLQNMINKYLLEKKLSEFRKE